ncbi:MAG: hypothetical protein ACQGVC_03865 [Myxococcota bacterium]
MTEAMRAAGGQIYAITSEPQALAGNAQEDWETGLEHVGDPHQEIAGEVARRGWLSLFTNHFPDTSLDRPASWVSHPGGYFQPGVLVLSREGRVLYRWRCRPDRRNVGGAVARPLPGHVWERVQAALAEPAGAPDVPHDDDPRVDSPPVPWPLFVTLLLANGWFLRPAYFDQRPGADTVPRRQRNALLRIPPFVALWVAAAWWLPLWAVAGLFAGWVAWIVPGIRQVNASFQNVAPGEEPA